MNNRKINILTTFVQKVYIYSYTLKIRDEKNYVYVTALVITYPIHALIYA